MRVPSILASLLLISSLVTAVEPQPKPLTPAEAIKKVKEKVTVEMLVKSSGGNENCYLNSEEDFMLPSNLTVFLNKDAKDKFKKAGIEDPALYFKLKTIIVTGTMIVVKEKPRIAVNEPDQIQVVDKK